MLPARSILFLPSIVASLLCAGAGCQSAIEPPASAAQALLYDTDGTKCGTWGCGANGPVLGESELGPLSSTGVPNGEGAVLVPASFAPGDACGVSVPLALRVDRGEFIAVDAQGVTRCSGPAMIGSTFVVENLGVRYQLGIARHALVPLWTEPLAKVTVAARHYAPAYEIVVVKRESVGTQLELEGDYHLCAEAGSWLRPGTRGPDIGFVRKKGQLHRVVGWGEPGHWAMLVSGELYEPATASVVPADGADRSHWFNIACAGGALAKMKLLGYDPSPPAGVRGTTTPEERQATLKMITAKYCGDRSYTRAGHPAFWVNRNGWAVDELPESARVGAIEARWSARGAECIGHTRYYSRADELRTIADLRRGCGRSIPRCDDLPDGEVIGEHWQSYVVDHDDTPLLDPIVKPTGAPDGPALPALPGMEPPPAIP